MVLVSGRFQCINFLVGFCKIWFFFSGISTATVMVVCLTIMSVLSVFIVGEEVYRLPVWTIIKVCIDTVVNGLPGYGYVVAVIFFAARWRIGFYIKYYKPRFLAMCAPAKECLKSEI